MKKQLKTELKNCIQSYFDKEYDIKHKESGTPKISVYYMLGYLCTKLGRKITNEIEEYMDKIVKERNE